MTPRSIAPSTALPRIRAITLDLDDTLWPATPTFVRAEQRAHAWLAAHAPAVTARWSIDELRALRQSIYESQPQLRHDFLRMRRLALTTAFEQVNLNGAEAQALIEQALHVYMNARNEVDLYPEVRASLARLARRYALASLTNGNADVARIGLGEFFSATVSAHVHGVSKPEAALFHHACRSLDCAPKEVVHVGDDAELDVRGARAAGLTSVWMNRSDSAWAGDDAPVVVKDLVELEQWLARHDA